MDSERVRAAMAELVDEVESLGDEVAALRLRVSALEADVPEPEPPPVQPEPEPDPEPQPGTVASVEVWPTPHGFDGIGQRQQYRATARDASGAAVDGRAVNWTTVDPSVVTVGATGVVTAIGNGATRVLATVDGARGSADVWVRVPSAPPPPPPEPEPEPEPEPPPPDSGEWGPVHPPVDPGYDHPIPTFHVVNDSGTKFWDTKNGQYYKVQFGPPAHRWSLSGDVPPTMVIDETGWMDGVIRGAESRDYTFTVTSNTYGELRSGTFTIPVIGGSSPPPPPPEPEPEPEPEPPPPVEPTDPTGAWVSVDFADYATTAELEAVPGFRLTALQTHELVRGVTPSGGDALRFNFPVAMSAVDMGAGLEIRPVDAGQRRVREMWIEVWTRVSPTWTTEGIEKPAGRDQYTGSHKFLLLFENTEASSYRWEDMQGVFATEGEHQVMIAGGTKGIGRARHTFEYDGQWHRYRYHARMDQANGRFMLDIDGTKRIGFTGGQTASSAGAYFVELQFGANNNRGTDGVHDMWHEIADIVVHASDPGWGF